MAKKKAAAGSSAKKATKKAAKKAPAKKAAAKKSTKKAAAKKSTKKAAKKAPAKKAAAKKVTKKAPAKKAVKKAPAKKAAAEKAPAKKTKTKATAEKAASSSTTKKAVKASVASSSKAPEIPKWLKDKKWLEKQRAALLEERAKQTSSAEVREAEAAALMADRDPGDVQFDEESGEGDTLAVERDRDLALSARAREIVDEIDAAIMRIENGTYGICASGEDIIPKERLEFLPMAQKCVRHQTSMF